MDENTVSDIKLSGDIGISSTGDIALVFDNNNLQQRIANRLQTNQELYLFGDFGSNSSSLIDYSGGDLIEKLQQSITAELTNEDNIDSIDEVNVTQDNDTFYVDIQVTAVSGDTLSVSTTIGG